MLSTFWTTGAWPVRNYVIITYIRTPTKRFLKIHFEFAHNSISLIHLETSTFTHSRSFLEPYLTPDQIVKAYTRFQTEKPKNLYPLGRYMPMWVIRSNLSPPPPPPGETGGYARRLIKRWKGEKGKFLYHKNGQVWTPIIKNYIPPFTPRGRGTQEEFG